METTERVSVMMMYEDESVEVRYRHGAQLQLSPCGSEFVLVKATDPTERVRQRSRFTISAYKELMVTALAFRNKYASRPYLPEELITADKKKPFFSIDSGVKWPEWSSYKPEFGPGGEITVRSEEGRSTLVLSPSGEEFSVEFTCSLSQPQHPTVWSSNKDPDGRLKSQQQPEEMYQSTTVIQHHSCFAVKPTWAYALSLARHHWTSCLSNSKDTKVEETSNSRQDDEGMEITDKNHKDRESQLPQALSLTCPSPHRHRWRIKDPPVEGEVSDLPTELVKILWCQGVTYRILSGAVPVVEVSPGDGSVIRSNGVLNYYFTHHKPKLQSEEVREITYHLSSLPPDVPGQLYPVGSIVSRANRILVSYNQAKHLLKVPAMPTCLQQDKHISTPTLPEQNMSSAMFFEKPMNMPQTAGSLSEAVAAELEKIKRFNFLLENNHLLGGESEPQNSEATSSKITLEEPLNEDSIAEALQRTSKAIKEIDALISATTLN
ncbi:uncharacterized protein C5orf34 homolog [Girardinichthys multiradiatus]|uniref:uncharacterized protein C5orf34 homolog n=1 Tax=Girardinichthys multiradiatus TaxID=208333 RepID=UPI001FADC651|nr:uncharacterized protein C5orf34 homolog [Girardinichthys multiradiatus]XP_047237543.1 uncharacterized protein C5orf34 homolog [Girardinichthys multiradiatus]XP_047237544.1 uncharacterized protein C5orf34 homolog [Girardinichthys multiradiatus]